jgi:PelA/Pel-15E family pectate lyase
MAYLKAFAAAGDAFYRDAARETAEALVYGQLQSGGWTQTIEFGPAKRVGKYRNGKGGNWNASSLDDDQTQAALSMLIRADQALGSKHAAIHEAAEFGLKSLLAAQFPNGAFPQIWQQPVPAKPVMNAKFPGPDWRTEGKVKNYWDYYTLNDGLAGTVADVLILAHETYKDDRYKTALAQLGDFLILAQMPDPQPGWCQQYGYDMVPMWARKFEPPAVTGWESQDAMRTLIKISRHTGDAKYLEPIPRALAYFKKSLLPDGRVARFYEFGTNKPLYMDAKYQLTHDDSAAPTHYGWKQPARFDVIEKALKGEKPAPPKVPSADAVRKIVAELDADGRWVSVYAGERLVGQPKFAAGFRYVSSEVFARNVEALAAFLAK